MARLWKTGKPFTGLCWGETGVQNGCFFEKGPWGRFLSAGPHSTERFRTARGFAGERQQRRFAWSEWQYGLSHTGEPGVQARQHQPSFWDCPGGLGGGGGGQKAVILSTKKRFDKKKSSRR